jgi:glycogen(starch) synthase
VRILIYTHSFAPQTGGVETYVKLLADGLARAGRNVTVVTLAASAGLDDNQFPFTVARRPSLLQLWRMIGQADVLQLAGPSLLPLLMGLFRQVPVVIEQHGYQAICPNGLLLRKPELEACPGHFMAGAYQKCLRCVASSEGWLSSFFKLLLTFPRRWMCSQVAVNTPITRHVLNRLDLPRSRVLYYGIPDPFFKATDLAVLPSATPCFAYVGRLVQEKGLPLLIEAAGLLRERNYSFQLKFVGDGPERTHLEALAARQGLKSCVTFTGFLSGTELQQATSDVAVVVMPSIWEETAGLAAMEQMMRGRLVIAADIGGLAEVVDGSGLKFTPGNAGHLAQCMQRVLDHPEVIIEIGRQARTRALEMFSQNRMIDDHFRLYAEVSGSHLYPSNRNVGRDCTATESSRSKGLR